MIGGRAEADSVATNISCHSVRTIEITEYLRNGGRLKKAQQMSNHDNSRTISYCDRRQDRVSLDEVERISI